ncbi:uncharacterized protein RCC_02828 [Ramularia collo-cygni]|uniref:Uncharacterized protein n=1 Tax=Ramularia collo-cygni TaxID=112498 RepID=A0A2D3V0E7_9PEZI|nr:uncharacterized protein RCC_02828 [Ramularia collo-cygni]CZT16996.1 uncharacterized protein RCC_02828 [Ramularia collo-cygni]
MSDILAGSPAKLERVERHLIRQRGAGVRNLATSFGFSLALSVAPVTAIDLDAPPAKRRKSTAEEKAPDGPSGQPEGNVVVVKPKKFRRMENVVEDEAGDLSEHKQESFSTTVKKRGRPKKTHVHVEVDEVPVITAVPAKRPRKNAATNALAKVAEGFAEEAQPIDKKRRDPQPEKAARKSRKKTASAEDVNDAPADSTIECGRHVSDEAVTPLGRQEVQHVEIMKAKPAARSTKGKRKPVAVPIKRVPLGETHANIPSKSPEKQTKVANEDAAESRSPSGPKRIVKAKSKPTTTESSSQKLLAVEGDGVAIAPIATNSELESRRQNGGSSNDWGQCDHAGTSDQSLAKAKAKPRPQAAASRSRKAVDAEVHLLFHNRESDAENNEESRPPPLAVENGNAMASTAAAKHGMQLVPRRGSANAQLKGRQKLGLKASPQEANGGTELAERRSVAPEQKVPPPSKRAATIRPVAKTTEMGTAPQEEEDLDWLFETTVKRKRPTRQTKQKPPAKTARRAQSPEVDLDEMLSNIASWAPKRR